MISLSSNPAFSGVNKPAPKFGEAPSHALSSELMTAWDKTSHTFTDLIKPKLPDIQKEGKAFNEAVAKGDQKAAQKHFEATIDRVSALVGNTLQAMKSKFPEIMVLRQAPAEQKKQLVEYINRTLGGKFQQLAKQNAAPKLESETMAFIDKAVARSVDAVKPEIPAFIKAKQDFQKATQKIMTASDKAMEEAFTAISKELPESLKDSDSSREHNKQVAEYSRLLVKQKLSQATEELTQKSHLNS